MKIEFLGGLYVVILGLMLLFFPGLVLFRYGLNNFADWVGFIVLLILSLFVIIAGISAMFQEDSEKTQEKKE